MRYSEIFNISNKKFLEKGIFNADIEADSHLHIDPALFKDCKIPEFVGAYDEFRDYFVKVFSLVPLAKVSKRAFKGLVNHLTFGEIANTCLGYSKDGTRGTGIGPKLAGSLASSIIEIYDLGIHNPVVFEMLPFFEDGIGADRISDMTSKLLVDRLLRYTKRMCIELGIVTSPRIRYKGLIYNLPSYNGQSFVFVPMEILCDLPMARDWDDIDRVCAYNRAFRARISEIIGAKITEVNKMSKKQIKKFLLSNPDVFNEFLDEWGTKKHASYDIYEDKKGVIMKNKKIFISYSWESKEHEEWVRTLAKELSEHFDVRIDSKLPLGADLNVFMEQSVSTSDKVLLILTPEYKDRADNRKNGVGYETNVITNDMIKDNNTMKFIPIIRIGDKNSSFPIYLGNKKGLDMTNDNDYEEGLNILIDNLSAN